MRSVITAPSAEVYMPLGAGEMETVPATKPAFGISRALASCSVYAVDDTGVV